MLAEFGNGTHASGVLAHNQPAGSVRTNYFAAAVCGFRATLHLFDWDVFCASPDARCAQRDRLQFHSDRHRICPIPLLSGGAGADRDRSCIHVCHVNHYAYRRTAQRQGPLYHIRMFIR